MLKKHLVRFDMKLGISSTLDRSEGNQYCDGSLLPWEA